MSDRAYGSEQGGGAREQWRQARERALELLYEAEIKRLSVEEVLAALPLSPDPLARELAQGVDANRARIDELLARFSQGWSVERMPSVDRAVCRIGTYELLERHDTSTAVILNEAVELAKRFSTDDSGRFVNGLLAALAREIRQEPLNSGAPASDR